MMYVSDRDVGIIGCLSLASNSIGCSIKYLSEFDLPFYS